MTFQGAGDLALALRDCQALALHKVWSGEDDFAQHLLGVAFPRSKQEVTQTDRHCVQGVSFSALPQVEKRS